MAYPKVDLFIFESSAKNKNNVQNRKGKNIKPSRM